nr:MAG TPA: hypothetical protein [Bacteriophage sp.]
MPLFIFSDRVYDSSSCNSSSFRSIVISSTSNFTVWSNYITFS